jgi:hypothetical protein
VLHQIGAGALGPVFRAYEPDSDRLVVVKLFRLDLTPERVHVFASALEALVGSGLSHPGIVAPIATGIVGASAYLAEEFVAAESFDIAARDHGPWSMADAVRAADILAGALDAASEVEVLHGSMHPRDVLMSADEVRLTGLGIASALEGVGVVPPVRRPYAPPERVEGREWDRRADVFSLGVLIREMVWSRRLQPATLRAVGPVSTDAAEREGVVPHADVTALRAVLARATAHDPAARFETALEFAAALRETRVEPAGGRTTTRARPRRAEPRHADSPSETVVAARLPLEREPEPEPVVRPIAHESVPLRQRESVEPERESGDESRERQERDREEEADEANVVDETEDVEPEQESLVAPRAVVETLAVDDLDLRVQHASSDPADEPDLHGQAQQAAVLAVSALRERLGHSAPSIDVPLQSAPAPFGRFLTEPDPPSSFSRGMWPLGLALLVGVALGFAAGYGVATRERPVSGPSALVKTPAPVGTAAPVALAAPAAAAPAAPAAEQAPARPPVEHEKPEPQPARPGRLLVRSTPGGAHVAVDGQRVGATPVSLDDMAVGVHTVRITAEGYAPQERKVTVTEARPSASLAVTLTRERHEVASRPAPAAAGSTTGGLVIASRPAGARVYVDGKIAGITPLTIGAIKAGSHAIRIERERYQRWTSSVRVEAGLRAHVSASLEH